MYWQRFYNENGKYRITISEYPLEGYEVVFDYYSLNKSEKFIIESDCLI
jgi:hypothetical protein